MARDEKSDSFATTTMAVAIVLTMLTCYYQMAPTLAASGVSFPTANKVMLFLSGMLVNTWTVRLTILLMCAASAGMKNYRKVDVSLAQAIIWPAVGTAMMLLPTQELGFLYVLTCISGMSVSMWAYSLPFRRVKGGYAPEEDSFLQTDELIETEYSVNIPYHYFYKGKRHNAYINVVAPFRASLVMGVPGSGKSFAIYNKFLEDQIRRGYTMFIYDYKFPDLTEEVLTEICYQTKHEGLAEKVKTRPKLYIINFDDPSKSNRCNPIHHKYITDPADTTEIADTLFKNINKGKSSKDNDFFTESAKVYLDALTYFLANYDPEAVYEGKHVKDSRGNFAKKGCYCTFPHLIELMAQNYKKVFKILEYTEGLEAKISPFKTALEEEAGEQLAGQIASAQIPLGRFVSPVLYWVMTGDDFTLDLNNPEAPKILCIGNNPNRQNIYGSAIALYTMQMFKLMNQKGKLPSTIILDEVPTIFIKGLDNLIATARSNKVGVVLGAQDFSQIERDYGREEAKVIYGTIGNKITGQVDSETAEQFSKMLGKEFKERKELTVSDDSDSTRISYNLEELMPPSKIGTLSQGQFLGRLADNFDTPIAQKLFCGTVDVDMDRAKRKKGMKQRVPYVTDFFKGQKPLMDEQSKTRLENLYTEYKGDEKKLYEIFLREKMDEKINENFFQIKHDMEELVDKEYDRVMSLIEHERTIERARNI